LDLEDGPGSGQPPALATLRDGFLSPTPLLGEYEGK
jgi:hypothetical protein